MKKTTPLPVVGVLACSQSLSLPGQGQRVGRRLGVGGRVKSWGRGRGRFASLLLPQKLKMATSRPPLGQLPGTKRCGKDWNSRSVSRKATGSCVASSSSRMKLLGVRVRLRLRVR